MFESIIRTSASAFHSVLIPVVYASPNEPIVIENDTILERFKAAVTPHQYTIMTPEVANFLGWIQQGFMFGTPIGAVIHSKNQYMDFMENARAYQYKWHFEAKSALTSKMLKGGARGACIWGYKSTILATTFGLLVNLVPILRNEHSWPEHIIAGLVTGILGGHLFSDRFELGFEDVKMKGRFTYKQMCFIKGAGFGLIFGVLSAVYEGILSNRSATEEMKKWEKYWKQRQIMKQNKDVSDR